MHRQQESHPFPDISIVIDDKTCPRGEVVPRKDALESTIGQTPVEMVVDEKHWAWLALTQELGEALLDAERTFIVAVDDEFFGASGTEEAVDAYLDAWCRLDKAHKSLAAFLEM